MSPLDMCSVNAVERPEQEHEVHKGLLEVRLHFTLQESAWQKHVCSIKSASIKVLKFDV